jgi:hypothetical protein
MERMDDMDKVTNQLPEGQEEGLDGSQGSPSASRSENPRHLSKQPRPWIAYRPKVSNGWYYIGSPRRVRNQEEAAVVYGAGEEAGPMAEFIVQAVNAHETMIRALRLVAESGPLNNGMRDENTMAIVREALALALAPEAVNPSPRGEK